MDDDNPKIRFSKTILGTLIPAHLEEYKQFAQEAQKGIFTRITRRRLVGDLGLSGRDRTKNDFWFDQRERVKTALKDLEIFLMVSGSSNVEQVFTLTNVKPFIDSLLWNRGDEPNKETAKIASYLIESGFTYLRRHNSGHLTDLSERSLNDAIDVTHYLTSLLIPDEERQYYRTSWPDEKGVK